MILEHSRRAARSARTSPVRDRAFEPVLLAATRAPAEARAETTSARQCRVPPSILGRAGPARRRAALQRASRGRPRYRWGGGGGGEGGLGRPERGWSAWRIVVGHPAEEGTLDFCAGNYGPVYEVGLRRPAPVDGLACWMPARLLAIAPDRELGDSHVTLLQEIRWSRACATRRRRSASRGDARLPGW
jgi:hypothetical protein